MTPIYPDDMRDPANIGAIVAQIIESKLENQDYYCSIGRSATPYIANHSVRAQHIHKHVRIPLLSRLTLLANGKWRVDVSAFQG